ncbi:MAG: hypothetical protein II956_03375 [Bacteroidales bacterium]|nr:hypothetical protein [Bacteroidales bacterium]
MKNIYIIWLFIILFCGCNTESDIYVQIERTDSLLQGKQLDSATSYFKAIKPPKKSEKCMAFYDFIKIRLFINRDSSNIITDSLFHNCINYYNKKNDYEKSAFLNLYKSYFHVYKNEKDSAFFNLQRAEKHAQHTQNLYLKFKIYELLSVLSTHYYDTQSFKEYSQKALLYADSLKDNKKIALSTYFLAECYYENGIQDSAAYFMDRSLAQISIYDDYYKARVYTTAADIMQNTDLVLSEQYYHTALNIYEIPDAYLGLSKISIKKQELEAAEKYFQKIKDYKSYKSNIEIMQLYANALAECKNYEQAYKVLNDISIQKDSLLKESLRPKIQNIVIKNNITQNIITTCLSFFFTLIIIKKIINHKKNGNLEDTQKQINEIVMQRDEFKKNVAILNKQLSHILEKESEKFKVGQKNFESIEQNRSISQQTEWDLKCIIQYYKSTNYDFISNLEYYDLNTRQMIFCILEQIGKNKEETMQILALPSENAYKTMKSRIKKIISNNI